MSATSTPDSLPNGTEYVVTSSPVWCVDEPIPGVLLGDRVTIFEGDIDAEGDVHTLRDGEHLYIAAACLTPVEASATAEAPSVRPGAKYTITERPYWSRAEGHRVYNTTPLREGEVVVALSDEPDPVGDVSVRSTEGTSSWPVAVAAACLTPVESTPDAPPITEADVDTFTEAFKMPADEPLPAYLVETVLRESGVSAFAAEAIIAVVRQRAALDRA